MNVCLKGTSYYRYIKSWNNLVEFLSHQCGFRNKKTPKSKYEITTLTSPASDIGQKQWKI
jgi:hypothetical protein